MSNDQQNLIKHRQLRFHDRSPQPLQAATALRMLNTLDPVIETSLRGPHAVQIAYDLRRISLYEIEQTLVELGFSLHDSLGSRIRRGFVRYTEEIERGKLGDRPPRGLQEDLRRVFVSRYRHRQHRGSRMPNRTWRKFR